MIRSHVDDTFTVLKVLMILSHACPCIVSPLLPLFLPPFELLLFHDPYLALFYLLPPAFVFLAGKNKPQDLLEGPCLVIWAWL